MLLYEQGSRGVWDVAQSLSGVLLPQHGQFYLHHNCNNCQQLQMLDQITSLHHISPLICQVSWFNFLILEIRAWVCDDRILNIIKSNMSILVYHQHPKQQSCQVRLVYWQVLVEKMYQSRNGADLLSHSVGLLQMGYLSDTEV